MYSQKAVFAHFTSERILPFGRRTPHTQKKVIELFEFELNSPKVSKYNELEKIKIKSLELKRVVLIVGLRQIRCFEL